MRPTLDSSERSSDAGLRPTHFEGCNHTCYTLQGAMGPANTSGTSGGNGHIASFTEETMAAMLDPITHSDHPRWRGPRCMLTHNRNPTNEPEPFVSMPPAESTAMNMSWSPEQATNDSDILSEFLASSTKSEFPNTRAYPMTANVPSRPFIAHQSGFPNVDLRLEPREQISNTPLTLASRQLSPSDVHVYRPLALSITSKGQRPAPRSHSVNSPYPSTSDHHQRTAVQECHWLDHHGVKCGGDISFANCSAHLADHGIKNLKSIAELQCMWQGCQLTLKRESIVRHVREKHLNTRRASGSMIEGSPRLPSRGQSMRYRGEQNYSWPGRAEPEMLPTQFSQDRLSNPYVPRF